MLGRSAKDENRDEKVIWHGGVFGIVLNFLKDRGGKENVGTDL